MSKAEIFERQVTTLVSQASSKAGDAERLAGGASDKKVNWSIFGTLDLGEVADKWNVGIVMGQNCTRRGLDLGIAKCLPSKWLPCGGGGADAGTDIDVPHYRFSILGSLSMFDRWTSKVVAVTQGFSAHAPAPLIWSQSIR